MEDIRDGGVFFHRISGNLFFSYAIYKNRLFNFKKKIIFCLFFYPAIDTSFGVDHCSCIDGSPTFIARLSVLNWPARLLFVHLMLIVYLLFFWEIRVLVEVVKDCWALTDISACPQLFQWMSPSGDSHRVQQISLAKQARENAKYWCAALLLSLKAQSVSYNLSRLSGFKHRQK